MFWDNKKKEQKEDKKALFETKVDIILPQIEETIDKMEEKNRQIRELLMALEYAIEGISKLSADGKYEYTNKKYANMAGYEDAEELIGKRWTETVHEEDIPMMSAAYQEMLRKGKVRKICRGVQKDGTVFNKEVVMVSIINGSFRGHWCFMTDPDEGV
jgi:PAS domain S-box-containing protein